MELRKVVTRLVDPLVWLMVKWSRPFLLLADFKPQPRVFSHLAHLRAEVKYMMAIMVMMLVIKLLPKILTLPSLLLPLPLLFVRLVCS